MTITIINLNMPGSGSMGMPMAGNNQNFSNPFGSLFGGGGNSNSCSGFRQDPMMAMMMQLIERMLMSALMQRLGKMMGLDDEQAEALGDALFGGNGEYPSLSPNGNSGNDTYPMPDGENSPAQPTAPSGGGRRGSSPTNSPAEPDSAPAAPTDSTNAPPLGSAPGSNGAMQRLANAARNRAGGRTTPGFRCLAGVQDALENAGLATNRKPHAYMLRDELRGDKRFQEISVSRDQLSSLPPGAVIVWQRFGTGATAESGHAAISLGNGQEASDYIGNLNHRNAEFNVFVPKAA